MNSTRQGTRSIPSAATERRFNALKHGIMAREVLVRTSDMSESEDDLIELATGLRAHLAPEGALEDLLVDLLVALTWRWRRVLRYETASIAYSATRTVDDMAQRQAEARKGNFYFTYLDGSHLDRTAELASIDADLAALDTPDPLSSRPDLWRAAFDAVEDDLGLELTEILDGKSREQIEAGVTAAEIEAVFTAVSHSLAGKGPGVRSRDSIWASARTRVAARRDRMAVMQDRFIERRAIRLGCAALPDDKDMAKVGRYEAHLSRQFYRALHELTALQAAHGPTAHPETAEGPDPSPDPSALPHELPAEPNPTPPATPRAPSPLIVSPSNEGEGRVRGHPSSSGLRNQAEPFALSYYPCSWPSSVGGDPSRKAALLAALHKLETVLASSADPSASAVLDSARGELAESRAGSSLQPSLRAAGVAKNEHAQAGC